MSAVILPKNLKNIKTQCAFRVVSPNQSQHTYGIEAYQSKAIFYIDGNKFREYESLV